jgi:hypothetical protein
MDQPVRKAARGGLARRRGVDVEAPDQLRWRSRAGWTWGTVTQSAIPGAMAFRHLAAPEAGLGWGFRVAVWPPALVCGSLGGPATADSGCPGGGA